MTRSRGVFDLDDRLAAKAAPALVAADEEHFAAIARTIEQSLADLADRLDVVRREGGRHGQAALDRDQEVHRLTARIRTLRRFGLDLCLGRMVPAEGEPVYVGRLGLTDRTGRRLLVDWRSPAAEPFFGATHADPRGLLSRRRYRWTLGRISDYWDEVFTADGLAGHAALDDQSAFLASLGGSRSERMRDVLATIQADQDAIIRAGSRGVLVVDGGPGTGKTVVALHRAAYLLHADPRLGHRRGGVLVVGPHQPYLSYVADVLPSLGEDGVATCTLRDLVPEGATAVPEPDPEVARLKADAALVAAIEPAVALYEEPPTEGLAVQTPWSEVWLSAAEWAEAFGSADPGTPHNEARDQVWEELLAMLVDKHDLDEDDPDPTPEQVRRALARDPELRDAFDRAWPLIEAEDLVGDLWTVPAYLRHCAPSLTPAEVRLLRREDPRAWTVADLPLLDAARHRLGDPAASRRRRRQEAATAAQRARMADVVDHLVAIDDSDMRVMSMLRGADLQESLADPDPEPDPVPGGSQADRLAGPFAHVVVDEAQELDDAQWQMLLRRCPARSLTVVGDRAQARHGFAEPWPERLARVGLEHVQVASLRINYRTPAEVMAAAEPVIRAVLPDANVPTSVRTGGRPVRHARVADLPAVLADWLAAHAEGTACVVTADGERPGVPDVLDSPRVQHLTPTLAKGLEFDLVVLVEPERFGAGEGGLAAAVDRYVAMTRATRELVVLGGP
ncbi:RNA polymerase recycling motor ATPase HelR [Nocardioides marmotae]|uniref:RNA polymerase recycling motor ATPase HelR n=1 Tax=Nocardioides marmotae TaxID=2663857 RepID=UPI00132A23C1|nr:RNA polymerase recycling motor ATPase HelR [Nocardioides marmotae]MBC9731840.1 AAA family ATPase [Nocardioides marmotae]MTB82959.1 AAA family ATPase [Nocardioides marmotae]